MRVSGLLATFICLSIVLAEAAWAGPPKASLKFDAASTDALIIFETEPQAQVRDWQFAFMSFSLQTREWTYGRSKGWSDFGKIPASPGRSFHVALVKQAGTYAAASINTQGFWRACFNGGTVAFPIEAGKVNYIGLIDPNPTLAMISTDMPQSTAGVVYLFDTPRLSLKAASQRPEWSAAVSAFVAARFPNVTAPIVAQEPVETTFTPGKSMLGKICEKY